MLKLILPNLQKVYKACVYRGLRLPCLAMLLAIGFLIALAGNLFIRPLSYFLGADSENIIYVLPYLRCIVSYAPGCMLDVFLMTYIKNEGHPNVAMVSTVTGTVLNIILDCIFVFVFKPKTRIIKTRINRY